MFLFFAASGLSTCDTFTFFRDNTDAFTRTTTNCITIFDSLFMACAGFINLNVQTDVTVSNSLFYNGSVANSEIIVLNANSFTFSTSYMRNENIGYKAAISCSVASTGQFNLNVSTQYLNYRDKPIDFQAGSMISSNFNRSGVSTADYTIANNEGRALALNLLAPFEISYMTSFGYVFGCSNGYFFNAEGRFASCYFLNSDQWQDSSSFNTNKKAITFSDCGFYHWVTYDTSTLFDKNFVQNLVFTNCVYNIDDAAHGQLGLTADGLKLNNTIDYTPNQHLQMVGCVASRSWIYNYNPVPTRSPYPPCPPKVEKPKPKRPIKRVVAAAASLGMTDF